VVKRGRQVHKILLSSGQLEGGITLLISWR
jgi:hypothetical protein